MDEARKERRLKRGNRALRFRGLKNFLFWLTGVVSGFIIIAGLIFLAVYVLPTKTILGYGGISDTDEYVSDEIAEKSIVKALLGFSDYSVGDIPIIEKTLKDVVSSSGLENYITLDYEKLSSVKFSGNGESNFAGDLQSCLTVTATIESIGGTEMLGDLAKLPVFSWEEAVANPSSENFEPRLYYYMVSGDSVENGVFERAFTDEGDYVDGVDASTTTYLASLDKISVAEVKDILSARFGTVKIASLISAFGGAGEGETINKIFKDTTLNGLNSFTFDDVDLADVIEEAGNEQLFKILRSAAGLGAEETITIGSLSAIDFDNIYLADVIEEAGNEQLFKILRSAAGLGAAEPITIGSLSSLNFDNINLNDVIEETGNEKLYSILRSAAGLEASAPVTIADLSGLNFDNIYLTDVLEETGNEQLFKILRSAAGLADDARVTVNNLTNLDFNNISLADVLSETGNEKLYTILKRAAGLGAEDTITIGNLKTLDFDNIYLTDVIEEAGNEQLFKILRSAAGLEASAPVTIANLSGLNFDNIYLTDVLTPGPNNAKLYAILSDVTGEAEAAITVHHLSSFDTDNIHLSKIIAPESNAKLYNILIDASGVASAYDITVGSLSGSSFNIDNIKLSTVLDRTSAAVTDNLVLKSLLYNPDGMPNDEVTLGNIAEEMNNKKLSEIFNVTCFEEVGEGNTKATYDKSTSLDGKEVYTLNSTGTGDYRIADDAGVWLFMLYDEGVSRDGSGNAEVYTESGTTFSGLNDRVSGVDDNILSASIRQLVDAGILSDNPSYSLIYKKSISDVLSSYSGSGS